MNPAFQIAVIVTYLVGALYPITQPLCDRRASQSCVAYYALTHKQGLCFSKKAWEIFLKEGKVSSRFEKRALKSRGYDQAREVFF